MREGGGLIFRVGADLVARVIKNYFIKIYQFVLMV